MKTNNKFLLVHPEISRTKYNFAGVIDNEPLELEYICAMLQEHGCEVELWDGQVEKVSLEEKVKQYKPDYFYVCGRTRQENFMKEYCRTAKKYNQNTITIVGGIHAQHNYQRFYIEAVDFILLSFDIYHILKILQGEKKREISGICFKENKKWYKNQSQPFDINQLPRADRTYFYKHLDRYRYLELSPCAHVRTAYSCPYSCQFCYRNKLNDGKYVTREIEDVVQEIEEIQCDNIYIIDDDFLVDPNRIKRFIALIKEKNIHKRYVCYGRADFIARNEDILKQLKEIGFYYILVGLEAMDNAHLKSYHKKSSLNYNKKSIDILNKLGIHIMGMFIVDLDFTKKDFKQLYQWIKKYQVKHVAISIFTPEMGLATYQEYKDRIITKNPEHWDYLHVVAKPNKMGVKQYYFHYHVLLIKLFLRGYKDGIYDFIDYGYYIKSFLKNMFRFGGTIK